MIVDEGGMERILCMTQFRFADCMAPAPAVPFVMASIAWEWCLSLDRRSMKSGKDCRR